ncbi:MAG: XRE family transcriptional regulator [Clostridia bacterium]|nr:XRE family transcriptional regulator [Clostridia bacterium]NCC42007.1 XRE family transcriptional regulator [Clostridia bacterium]
MDYLLHNISINLKRIRKSKKMSLDVVAEQTGVSKSMLAQIERGEANPTIGTLGKIASGLRIEFDSLLEAPSQDTWIMSVEDTMPTKEIQGQYRVWTCFPYEDNRKIELYRIDIEPGGEYFSGSHGEKTREYISVSKGVLTMLIEDKVYTISENEVFRFESDKVHRYCNKTERVVSLMTFFVFY